MSFLSNAAKVGRDLGKGWRFDAADENNFAMAIRMTRGYGFICTIKLSQLFCCWYPKLNR